ncbi:MAG: hypothetical protein IH991_25465 [Planctomycetes bacterium]|nr:hypothetical protein [Planctomycetota bacterium]
MVTSRDKASRWINVALVVALLLAPVAWYVAVINGPPTSPDSGFDPPEPQLLDAVETHGPISTKVANFKDSTTSPFDADALIQHVKDRPIIGVPRCAVCQRYFHKVSINCLFAHLSFSR